MENRYDRVMWYTVEEHGLFLVNIKDGIIKWENICGTRYLNNA